MSDSNKTDHWDLLASTLGAEPRNSESKNIPPQTVEESPAAEASVSECCVEEHKEQIEITCEPSATVVPVHESTPKAPGKSSTNWDSLAMQLGIEVPVEPIVREPSPTDLLFGITPETAAPRIEEPAAESTREYSTAWEDELQPESDLAEHVEASSDKDEDDEDEDEKREHKPKRRRRHGRSRRGERDRDSRPERASRHDKSVEPADEEEPASEASLEASTVVDTESDSRPADEDSEKRGKRRRSRRGSRNRKKKGDEAPADKANPAAPADDEAPADDLNDIADEIHDESDKADGKSPFRAIPTWEEAVGLIISKNVESRPRRPSGGQGHSRGGSQGRRRR